MKPNHSPMVFHRWIIPAVFCLSFGFNSNLHAQLTFDWALSQGSKVSDFALSLKQDDQGHLYSTCTISDTADLDPGIGEDLMIPWFEETPVLTKWTTSGEYVWSIAFQTSGETNAFVSQIKDNRMLLYAYYTDSLVAVRQGVATPLSVNPGQHTCVMLMDLEGQLIQIRDIQNSFNFYFRYLAMEDDGQILGAGGFYDSLVLSTSHGDTTLYSVGSDDGFVFSLDQNWQAQWVWTFGSDADDYITSLSYKNGLIHYSGGYEDTMTLQTVNGLLTFPANDEANGLYGTLSPDGQQVTAQSFGGDLYEEIEDIDADQDGNVYICGSFEGEVHFEKPGAPPVVFTSFNLEDGFVSKYTADGDLVWARIISDSEYGGIHNIQIYRDESLYMTGNYNGHTDLDPGPDSIIAETGNWGDIYNLKMDKAGNLKWVYNYTGPDLEGIRTQLLSPDGRIYMMGFAYDTFDADPSTETFIVPNQGGGTDMFIMALTEENVITSINAISTFNLHMYPNPVTDELRIKAEKAIQEVSILTMDGIRLNLPVTLTNTDAVVRVSGLLPGAYIVRVKTENAFTSMSFIKS